MALRKGLPAKLAATDADDTRYAFSGLVVCNADGTPRGGVLSPVGVNLVTATATMNVSVVRFQGAAVRDAGVVLLANDGPTNVLHDAAPAANSRIDVVWAKQNDASGTVSVPDANNLPGFGVTKGTAGAFPAKPAIPAGTVELATVQIPSTATATNSAGVVITQTAQLTAAAGGVVPFRTKAEMDAVTTLPKGTYGVVLFDLTRWTFNASTWDAQTALDSGYVAPTLLNSWVNFGAPYSNARYRKVGGMVEVSGLIKSGIATPGTVIFNLPVGFRVSAQRMFSAVCASNVFAVLQLLTNGDLVTANVPSATYLSLDGIRFFADA